MEWGGTPGLAAAKNEALFKYTEKVMFQTYYYSAAITYRNVSDGVWSDYLWTPVYTDVLASVQYFPDRDAGDIDPLDSSNAIMKPDTAFQSAIESLFSAAMAASSAEDSSIRHFDIEVYN